jgi:hypothetical protein
MMAQRCRIAAAVLITFGLLTMGTGFYFLAFRPPLLPEDLRFAGVELADVPAGLLSWLSLVFRTLGGFVVGLGLCILGYGAAARADRPEWSKVGAGLGLLLAFGGFLATNIQIHSDFLWFVGVLFLSAIASAVVLFLPGRDAGRADG